MLKKEYVKGAPSYIVIIQEGQDQVFPGDQWGAGYTVPAKRWFFTAKDKKQLNASMKRHKRPGRTMTAYAVNLEKVDT